MKMNYTNKVIGNILGNKPKKDKRSKNKKYKLVWKGEVIEEDIETKQEAERLRGEYNMAYGGGVSLR